MMKDIFEKLAQLQKEVESMESFEKVAEDLVKEASEFTGGLVKTAEEAQIFYLGRIFGMGMGVGFMEKVAEAMEEAQAAQSAAAAAMAQQVQQQPIGEEPIVPQAVSSNAVDDEETVQLAMQLKQVLQSMTPKEILAWYASLDEETKAFVDSEPELSAYVEEAKKMLSAQVPADVKPGAISAKMEEEEAAEAAAAMPEQM